MNAFIAAAATFFVLAALTFFWIPGVAIIFAITGAVVGVAGAAAGRLRARPRRHIVWWGVSIALIGMICIPTINPIAGLLILMGGGAIAAAAPLIAAASS